MTSSLKHTLVRAATLPPIPGLLTRVLALGPAMFTLHRFEDKDSGVEGHPEASLRADLALVRRLGYRVLPAHEFVTRWLEGSLSAKCVSFTVDDGYRDFITRGAPIFHDYECPVAIFATTGFVDGALWFWWDQLEHLFDTTTHTSLTIRVAGEERRVSWRTTKERQDAWLSLVILLKTHPIDVQRLALADVAAALEVMVPTTPPVKYAPMSWDECNAWAGKGVTVGPHTISHPNLARAAEDVAREEIQGSWRRVQQAATAPIPILCYPYGDPSAFSAREARLAREAGLLAAVTFVDQRVPSPAADGDTTRYALPRLRYPNDSHLFAQQLVGLDELKQAVRRRLRGVR